jgi:thiamine kinase-like enzyme
MKTHRVAEDKLLINENKKLKSQLMKSQAEISRYKERVVKLNSQETLLRRKIKELEQKNKSINSQVATMQKTIRQLERGYDQLEKELGLLHTQTQNKK